MVGLAAVSLVDAGTRRILDADRWTYAVELTRLLQGRGYRVAWWQTGDGWRGEVLPGVPLHGTLRPTCQLLTWPRACEDFLEQANAVDAAIYFDLALAYPQVHEISLAVAHGMDWDSALHASRLPTDEEREEWRRRLGLSLRNPRKVVTADAGIMHWAAATWPGLQHAFEYIPGFLSALPPAVEAPARPGVTVLSPGPFSPERGISETIRAMEVLLARYPDLKLRLSGSGTPRIEAFLREWVDRHPGAGMDSHPLTCELLLDADIVLFPVKSGPGPILACLKAMAMGRAVVAGWAGGLGGLILQDHTGVVVAPGAENLVEAIAALMSCPDRRRWLGHHAREAAVRGFSLDRWQQRWTRLLDRVFPG